MSVIGYNLFSVKGVKKEIEHVWVNIFFFRKKSVNDPSAGSPTETLLRLLLPLNEQV